MKKIIDPTMDNTEWQKGVLRGRAKLEKGTELLIKAILFPHLEKISGIDEITTEILVIIAESFSDEVILGLAMEHSEHKGRYGFILNPRAFGISESKDRLAKVMTALMNRFNEAQKNKNDWEKYVCQLRKKMG